MISEDVVNILCPGIQIEHINDWSRCLFVGIGSEVSGDDAVGPYIAKYFKDKGYKNFWDAGVSLENYIFKIVESEYKEIILIDAVDFGAVPGSIRVVSAADIVGGGISTHSLNLKMAIELLRAHGKNVYLIGIQPEKVEFGSEMSSSVKKAVERLVEHWTEVFNA